MDAGTGKKTKVQEISEDVTWNRDRCIEFCLKQKLILANTGFKKTKEKTATFRAPGTLETEEIIHKKQEQIDYITVRQRWNNTITDAESNTKANLDTDHYPVTATCRIKLRASHNKKGPGRKKYEESTKEQKDQRNKKIDRQNVKIKKRKSKHRRHDKTSNEHPRNGKRGITHDTKKRKTRRIFRTNERATTTKTKCKK